MKFLEKLRDLVFPPRCLACKRVLVRHTVFCGDCLAEIPFVSGKCCEYCGIEMHPEFPSPVCARCRNLKPRFDKNVPIMEHVGLGRRCVLNVKYGSKGAIYDAAILMAGKLKEKNIIPSVVTFVPDYGRKSQVTEGLAYYIAKYLGAKSEKLIIKTRMTDKQKSLSFAKRLLNVRGAYKAVKVPEGDSVLIIDDVFTTGATMNECAKAIRKVYKGKIYTATFTIRDRE